MSKELQKQIVADAKIAQSGDELARLDQLEQMVNEASEKVTVMRQDIDALGTLLMRIGQAVMIRRITVLQEKTAAQSEQEVENERQG